MSELQKYIQKIAEGQNLDEDESIRAFQIILMGGATPAQIAAMMMGLRMKGETVEELTGAAFVMRSKCEKIKAPEKALDTCGTGGDNAGTLNISTAVAFVVAACGIPVAKHGNRAVSSRSGSADVLKALGVNLEASKEVVEKCLAQAGICFMSAQQFHPGMRHVGPVRTELGIRSIFNLLGPLSNPAGTKYHVMGVYAPKWVKPMAEVLKELGANRAWVVHGSDGLDELTITGNTYVASLENGVIRTFDASPTDAGIAFGKAAELKGGDAEHNAQELRDLLRGRLSAYRNAVLFNAAACLQVGGAAANLKEGATLAAQALDSGKAMEKLQQLVSVSNS